MKTTSYIITGLVAAVAVLAFAGGMLMGAETAPMMQEKEPTDISGELESIQMERFSAIDVKMYRYCDSLRVSFIIDPEIIVKEDAEAEGPRIEMNADWTKYLTLQQSADSLTICFDFHELLPGKTFTDNAERGWWRFKHEFFAQPITIYVPPKMLMSVNQNKKDVPFSFKSLRSDSLALNHLANVSFMNCRISTLAFSGEWSSGDIKVNLAETEIDRLNVNACPGTVSINGADSSVGKLVWTAAASKIDRHATLKANENLIHDVEWVNRFNDDPLTYKLTVQPTEYGFKVDTE
ncbi:MAG: hypothetical protein NC127_03765 [Muribaculum sp.]|nr:hypothetical protein [Muribaculum sp.]